MNQPNIEHQEQETMNISSSRIRHLRHERGWSQEQLALASGLSLRTIQRVETEERASRETRVCLAATFGVALVELIEPPAAGEPAAPLPSVARYKMVGAVAVLAAVPVLLHSINVIPAGYELPVSASLMLAIAAALFAGLGWYFSGVSKASGGVRHIARMLFVAVAIFCGFASFQRGTSADLTIAFQVGVLSVALYLFIDYLISKRNAGVVQR